MSEKVELEVDVQDADLEKLIGDLDKMKDETRALVDGLKTTGKALNEASVDARKLAKASIDGKKSISEYREQLHKLADAVRDNEIKAKAYAGVAKALADQLEKAKARAEKFAKSNNDLRDELDRVNMELKKVTKTAREYENELEKIRKKAEKRASLWTDEEIEDNKRWNKRMERQEKEAEGQKKQAESFSRSWLRAWAVFTTGKSTVENLFASIKEGAEQLDLRRILTQQFATFPQELAKAQELTQGIVAKGALTKSYALMSSFGIPMDSFSENMELVQKMAIRTGQSADFLTESFARGISRLSPLILDNLGIQVGLKDANYAYASSTGKVVTELTKHEQTAALLNETLRKLRDNTQGVSLGADSAAASVARFETFFADTWMKVKELGGEGIGAVDRAFQSQRSDVMMLSTLFDTSFQGIAKLKQAGLLGYLPTELERTRDAISLIAKHLPEAAEPWDQYWGSVEHANTAIAQSIAIMNERGKMRDEDSFSTRFFGDFATGGQLKEYGAYGEAITIVREEQQNILEIADQILQKNKEGLTVSQKKDLVELATARIAEGSAARLKALDEGREISAKKIEVRYALINVALAATVAKWLEGNKANDAAMASLDLQVETMRAQALEAELLTGIREGQSLAELRLAGVLKEQSQTQQEIAKAEEEYTKAREEGRGKDEAALLTKLRLEEYRQNRERQFWNDRVQAEKKWLDGFKNASDTVLKAEITRLRALAAQLKALEEQAAQYKLIGDNLGHWGKGPLMLGGSAEAEARANALEGNLGGGGGGGGGGGQNKRKNAIKEWFKNAVGPWMSDQFESSDKSHIPLDATNDSGLISALGNLLGGPQGTSEQAMQEWQARLEEAQKTYREVYGSLSFDTQDYVRGLMGSLQSADTTVTDHLKRLNDWRNALVAVGEGYSFMQEGMDKVYEHGNGVTQQLFGDDVIAMVDGLGASLERVSGALGKQDEAYQLVMAGAPAMRAFTKELGANLRQQAAMEMLMNAAAAWAAGASGNWPKAGMHIAAASLYGLVAAKIVRLPSKSTEGTGGSGRGASRGTTEVHVHIQGDIVQTEAERGVMVQRAIDAARREGSI